MAGLVRAIDWFDNSLQNILASKGYPRVHRTQSMILVHIASGNDKPSDIGREMGLTRQNVHHMAKALIAAGLIEKNPDPDDPRRSIYRMAETAEEIRSFALDTLGKLEFVLAERIGKEDEAARPLRRGHGRI